MYRTESLAWPVSNSGKRLSEAGDKVAEKPCMRAGPASRDLTACGKAANPAPFAPKPGNLRSITSAWWAREDSNLQPSGYEPPALTIELRAPRAGAPQH